MLAELERLLEVDRVIVIPVEPGDVTGHADGVVRFVDAGIVIVNDYTRVDRSYRRLLMQRLKDAGSDAAEIPYKLDSKTIEGMPSSMGNFVNYLRVGKVLIMPTYGIPEDRDARMKPSRACHADIVKEVACREVASEEES